MTGIRTAFGYSEIGFATITDSLNPKNYKNYNVKNSGLSADKTSGEYKDVQKILQEKLTHVSFEIKRDENLTPYDISFEDYQYLNSDALDTIFGKDTERSREAQKIMHFATRSDDTILNEIFYNKMVDAKGQMSDMMINLDFSVAFMQMQTNLDNNPNIEFIDPNMQREFMDTPHSAEDFFNAFQVFENSLNDPSIKYNYDVNGTVKLMDKIKQDYEIKVKENEALLTSYTKNTKPNPIDNVNHYNDLKEVQNGNN